MTPTCLAHGIEMVRCGYEATPEGRFDLFECPTCGAMLRFPCEHPEAGQAG